jgi:hypothetical protein
VFGREVVAYSTKFALKPNSRRVKRSICRPKIGSWCAAARESIVVVIAKITEAVVKPSTNAVDKTCRIEVADPCGELVVSEEEIWLAPALVVDDLDTAMVSLCVR